MSKAITDPSLDPVLNGITVDGVKVSWAEAFPRPGLPTLPPGYVPRWEKEEA